MTQEISKCLVELSTPVGDVDRRFEQISGRFGGRLIFSLVNLSITSLINVTACWWTSEKSLVIGLSVSVESLIILHAWRNPNLEIFMLFRFLRP